jgi:hypothetical protein
LGLKFRAAFGSPLIRILASFRHYFMTALMAFGKTIKPTEITVYSVFIGTVKKYFKHLKNYKIKSFKNMSSFAETTDKIFENF